MNRTVRLIAALCALTLCLSTSAWSFGRKKTIKVGLNVPMTGDIPKVGEGSKYAAEMWLEDIKKAGGIEVGGKKYPVELIVEDNESKAESAVKANTKLITQNDVLIIVGPQSSKQAIPAGDVANNYETPMLRRKACISEPDSLFSS
ncbi:MAG: hypothetical protein D3910_08590 [Candidatus Electrothrix sp. ATG2]|nr:hypothetical protein [Candidatus Electrothrix sp. ATG2]